MCLRMNANPRHLVHAVAARVGEPTVVGPYSITLDGVTPRIGDNWTALEGRLSIVRDGEADVLRPQTRFFSNPATTTSESAILTSADGQLYAVLGQPDGSADAGNPTTHDDDVGGRGVRHPRRSRATPTVRLMPLGRRITSGAPRRHPSQPRREGLDRRAHRAFSFRRAPWCSHSRIVSVTIEKPNPKSSIGMSHGKRMPRN